MNVLAMLELNLLIIVMVHVHVVFRVTRILWLTHLVLFSLTPLYEPSASQNCSLLVLSHSSTTPGSEYIFNVRSCVLHFS